MKRLTIILLLCLTLATSYRFVAGERGWQELAVASRAALPSRCQDLQLAGLGASAAVAWTRIYFPNQQEAFVNTIEPLLCQIVAGVDAYCAAVELVKDASGFVDVLKKKSELLTLVERLETLIAVVKGQA